MSGDGKRPCRDLTALESSLLERVVKLEAEREELREALENLTRWARVANDAQHAGVKVTADVWSTLYQYANEASAALAKPRA